MLTLALLGALLGATLWLTHSWTETEASDLLLRAPEPMPAPAATGPEAAIGYVEDLVPPDATRTSAPVTHVPPTPAADAMAASPANRHEGATRVGLSGQVHLYQDGRLTEARLNGTIDVHVSDGDRAAFPLVQGRFEVVFHRQPSGGYATVDQKLSVGRDLGRVRFTVAAPKAVGTAPLLHYFPKTGAPRRGAESFPFGELDAIVNVVEAPALVLEVRAAESGLHLDQVSVVVVSDRASAVLDRTGEEAGRLASQEASPLHLVPGEPYSLSKATTLSVSAPGYAAKEITVDFTRSDRRAIELSAAGQLIVRIDGEIPAGSKLALYTQHQPSRTHVVQDRETCFDSLAPAIYVASLSARGVDDQGEPLFYTNLARGVVEVRAHETAELDLVMPSLESVVQADLAGTLMLPPAWEIRNKRITGRFMGRPNSLVSQTFILEGDDLVPVRGHPGSFAFEKKALEVGRYHLEFDVLNVAANVDVPPEGVRDVELIVAPPVNIAVSTECTETGEDLSGEVDLLFWSPKDPLGARSSGMSSVRRSSNTGKFHLTVPAGEILLQPGGTTLSQGPMGVLATEGLEIVLQVISPMTATVELRDGDELVPWPREGRLSARDASGNGTGYQQTPGKVPILIARAPGTYWIKLPEVGGYLPHGDVQVEMKPGPLQTVVVQLVRR